MLLANIKYIETMMGLIAQHGPFGPTGIVKNRKHEGSHLNASTFKYLIGFVHSKKVRKLKEVTKIL